MNRPNLKQAKEFAADYKSIPVSRKIFSDICTPVQVLRKLKKISRHCYMLESTADADKWGRYTFLGYDGARVIRSSVPPGIHFDTGRKDDNTEFLGGRKHD